MKISALSSLTIGSIAKEESQEACCWLLEDAVAIRDLEVQPLLLQAVQEGKRVGVLGVFFLPGATASLIGPRIANGVADQAPVAARLLEAATILLLEHQVTLGQTLLDRNQQPQSDWFQNAGFDSLISLDLLVYEIENFEIESFDPALDPSPVDWVTYADCDPMRFEMVMERTYEGSLDCKMLNGVRCSSDVLAGHRSRGLSDAWRLMCLDGQDAGCLLLTDDPEKNQCEIVYLGVVPECRGQGLGLVAACEAIRLATARRRQRVMLAVDMKNVPAQRVYTEAGFIICAQQQVQLRIFSNRIHSAACVDGN
ncbi:MAG: GNAT family N-acetyltransferase [Planctomycetales bacterium]